jgi:hypothetical protein
MDPFKTQANVIAILTADLFLVLSTTDMLSKEIAYVNMLRDVPKSPVYSVEKYPV